MPPMTHGMPTVSPAIDLPVNSFRKLMIVVLCAGAVSGLVLFALQHFTIVPLIESAERYETAEDHHHAEWQPAAGLERTGFTLLTTILSAIGFAAVFFGFLSVTGKSLNARRGALWGLAAFACFHLAPSIGLPPVPPGVPVADVQLRQLWWIGAVAATAMGLWLVAGRTWKHRIAGVVCILIPHLIGAPVAVGNNPVPAELLHKFAIASLATTFIFWPLLGGFGGFLFARTAADETRARN